LLASINSITSYLISPSYYGVGTYISPSYYGVGTYSSFYNFATYADIPEATLQLEVLVGNIEDVAFSIVRQASKLNLTRFKMSKLWTKEEPC
jgi:hypothetical protein